jgi:hypothetical protein
MKYRTSILIAFSILVFILANAVRADDYTSTNYKVSEPVMFSGGYSSSTNFQLFGAISQISTGTSTATNFGVNAGFLYFPFASSPVVSATAGNGQVALSWSASQGYLGWNVSGYNVGKSTTSGGPYSYASVGNVTSSTRTGLTNGTTYYFIVRAEDAFGNSIATSTEVSATPVAPSAYCGDGSCNGSETCSTCPADCGTCPGGGGGGGGGGGILPQVTRVILKGRAYPNANLTIFKDGTVVSTIKVGSTANFEQDVFVSGGIYTFSLYAISPDNQRSLTSSFTTSVPAGLETTISDIVIAPTIGADKSQVKIGNDINFFGYAYPQSQINVIINSEEVIIDKTASDKLGYWNYKLNSGNLELGDHTTKSQTVTPDNLKSPFSESLAFKVGDKDVAFGKLAAGLPFITPAAPVVCSKKGDINNDGKINIVDFSIMLYFWNQRSPKNACADINADGIVNLFDFSIMLYWWTG